MARPVIFGPDSKLPSRVMAQSRRCTEDRSFCGSNPSHILMFKNVDSTFLQFLFSFHRRRGGRNAVISVHLSGPEFAAATTRWRFRLWRFRFCNWPVTFAKDSDRRFGSCIICARQRVRLIFRSTPRFIRLGAFVIDRLFIIGVHLRLLGRLHRRVLHR